MVLHDTTLGLSRQRFDVPREARQALDGVAHRKQLQLHLLRHRQVRAQPEHKVHVVCRNVTSSRHHLRQPVPAMLSCCGQSVREGLTRARCQCSELLLGLVRGQRLVVDVLHLATRVAVLVPDLHHPKATRAHRVDVRAPVRQRLTQKKKILDLQ